MQNYLYFKFLLANLKIFTDVLGARYSWKMFLYTPLVLLLFYLHDTNTAVLSLLNEANLLQACHFVLVLFLRDFIIDVNACGLATTHSSCLRHQRPIIFLDLYLRIMSVD